MYRLLPLFLLFISSNVFATENKIMPLELYEVAKQHQCEAISDFYNRRPYGTDPPYVYGYLGGYKRFSAIFWCRSIKDKERYKLVVYSKYPEYVKDFNCPYEIQRRHPMGLALYKEQTVSLDGFYYVDNKKSVPEKAIVKNVTLIVSTGTESSGIEYFCYKGKWIARLWD